MNGLKATSESVASNGYSKLCFDSEAAAMGIRVLRCTPQQLKKGEILPVLKRALGLATEL